MKHIKILFAFFLMLVFSSCTKLEEKFKTDLEQTNSGKSDSGSVFNDCL